MILAAAACAAAGISYIFHDDDDDQSMNSKYETVTASSTIIDKQGIVKYVIHPRIINPYSFMYYPFVNQEQKNIVSIIKKSKSNQFELPIVNNKQNKNFNFTQEFSVVFFWSIPLKARLLQTSTKSCLVIENLNPFQRSLMKISIGIQNGNNENLGISNIPSEIALSNSNNTLDSLSYNPPMINDHIIPIGILKKKKLDLNEEENNNQKRFCLDLNNEEIMKNIILKNVHLCVENLSKILSESCSNTEEQLTTLQNSPSFISTINNNQQKSSSITQNIYKNLHSKLFKHLNSDLNNEDLIERLSDGIILHRSKQFGLALGEPMIRKYNDNENLLINSSHSIYQLNRLLSKTNCLLMRQYKIESIEDLIRLFLEEGQQHFTELMINLFKVNPVIVEQLNVILIKWAKQLT